jgi:hypothetical protein
VGGVIGNLEIAASTRSFKLPRSDANAHNAFIKPSKRKRLSAIFAPIQVVSVEIWG